MSITPQNLFRQELATMQAYQVPDSDGFVKLDAMENPYPFPEALQDQWLSTLKNVALNRYPDPQASRLKESFRKVFAFSPKLEIMLGNGSDELIQLLILAVAKPDACILTVTPSFSMYKLIAEYVGVRVIEIPLVTESFALPIELISKAIKKHKPALIFLACPNNPTGTLWPLEKVEQIVQETSGLVIVDEAYTPFTAYSLISLIEKYPHALMLRTLSKMGLAGLRLGWLMGEEQWLTELNKLRLPYNINALTQASAEFALHNISVFDEQARRICDQREQLINAMQNIKGIKVFPSEANFILFKTIHKDAELVFNYLIENKIMIKNVANNDLLKDCLRVTVGTESENQIFLAALKEAV